MKIIDANKDNFKQEVSTGTVLVDFNASWCGPCRMLKPILEEIAEEKPASKILSVDVDEESDLAMDYHISSIPCLILFKDGEETVRLVGLKSKEEIEKLLGD